ncbi:MAG TPA: metallophosphoesterase [Vicinamibacterales bacterium]
MGILSDLNRLWDLRRGDADDDRSSPHGRGWRALAISTALEFNYLTAAIAFVWLMLVPAVLVGLAVPIVTALTRWKLEAAGNIPLRPVAALISLAVLVAVVLWIARPLLAMSLDNFWHLHYTLVFPLFVAFRELISAGLERLPPDTLDAEQLHSRRRSGTVLATLLLAGAGVSLAAAFPVSTDAGLSDLRSISPSSLTGATVSNAIVVLGVSMAAASLLWFWLEITVSSPVANWRPDGKASGDATVRIAHLSDLHLVGERYGYRMEAGTHGPGGNGRVADALCRLEALQVNTPFARIVVTGDVTDAGTRAEWLEFLALVHRSPTLRDRLLFIPGNHDVNIIDRANPGRFDLPWSTTGALRKLRVILALDAVQGDRVHLVDGRTGRLGPTLAEYLRTGERGALLAGLAERGTWRGRWETVKVWDEIFPLVAPPAEEGCGVILLDSNARRHFSLTNAIGVIGRAQLRALASLLRAYRGADWIVAVHHHLVEYPVQGLGLDERIGVVLVNAPDVLRVIARHERPILVLHGHRHREWIGTRGKTVLCSAPSVTLGDKGTDDERCSFSLYDLALTGAEGMRLTAVQRVTVA